MNRVTATEYEAVYSTRRAVLLPAAAISLAGALGGGALYVPGAGRLALAVLAVVCAIVGLSRERLRLNFVGRRLKYETRIAGVHGTTLDEGLDTVGAVILVASGPVNRRDLREARPSYRIVLRHRGDRETPIAIGPFAAIDEAEREAAFLSERIGVPIERVG